MPPIDVPRTYLEFSELLADEGACERWFAQWRWPDGVECPRCRSRKMSRLSTRRLWQCRSCRHQTSVAAGTVMHRSKVSLRVWAYALWLMGNRRVSISALQLQRETGLRSYATAWNLLHKVRLVLTEREGTRIGRGVVETDESMIGGSKGRMARRLGKGGRWLTVGVERIEVERGTRRYRASGLVRALVTTSVEAKPIIDWIQANIEPGATIGTDGWSAYHRLTELGYDHERVVQGKPRAARRAVIESALPKVHLFFSNLKTWLNGTFHGVSGKYLELYVREHVYRFNRRWDPPKLFAWLSRRVARGTWTPRAGIAETTR